MAWRKINNLYPARCAGCRAKVERGVSVWYDRFGRRGHRVRCLECGAGEGGSGAVPGAGVPAVAVEVPVVPSGRDLVLGARAAPVDQPVLVEPYKDEAVAPAEAPVADDLAGAIARAVQGRLNLPVPVAPVAALDEDRVRAIAGEVVASSPAVRVELVIPDRPAVDVTGEHEAFGSLVHLMALRLHVWLVGPAGSGKTWGAERAAAALGLSFNAISVGEQTSVYQLMGHRTPDGSYARSLFRESYENGGVFLVDEVDAGNANVLTCLNAALANGACAFPDGMVKRHADFVCVAAGNTWGRGANRVYVGRCQIDGATLDRFAFLEWGYDEKLERLMAGDMAEWSVRVQAVRAAVDRLGVRHVVSPRASMFGGQMLAAGFGLDQVEAMVLWKGLDADSVSKVKAEVRS